MICASCGETIADGLETCNRCEKPALLHQNYRLLAIVGKGGNGITYRAERLKDGAVLAVKEMPLRMLESAKAIELFEREARVLRELRHDAIPRYEDDFVFGEGKSSALYLVQEFVQGKTLADEMKGARYDAPAVWKIVAEIASILVYLHRLSPPVIHRDVKLRNVMRRDDGRLVLIDFGAVRDALSPAGGSTVAGTFGYMAPEQLAGRATPASDIYALGALAAALLARKEPDAMLTDDHRVDVRAHADLEEETLELLDRMLESDPSERIQSAKEVVARASRLSKAEASAAKAKASSKKAAREQREKELREEAKREHTERKAARAERRAAAKEAREVNEEAPSSTSTRGQDRRMLVLVALLVALPVLIGLGVAFSKGRAQKNALLALATTTIGVPELYARPLVVDVNGDGTDDMILATAFDTGPEDREDEKDTWGVENGHFEAFVQAIDGKTSQVLYALGSFGKSYNSLGADGKRSEKIVLFTYGKLLGVGHVSDEGETRVDFHELASGAKKGESVSFGPSSGGVCEAEDGRFYFDGAAARGGNLVDLEKATTVAEPKPRGCGHFGPRVADAPGIGIHSKMVFGQRFSTPLVLSAGPYKGTKAIESYNVATFVRDTNPPPVEPAGPTVSFDDGAGLPGGRDNTKVAIVGVDAKTGEPRFEASLASLGLGSETVEHLEMSDWGVLAFLQGGGLAMVHNQSGKLLWSTRLRGGDRVVSYSLRHYRLYLHVFGRDNAVYGFLSKKLQSRIVVVDLQSGTFELSLPDGSRDPGPSPTAPSKKSPVDVSKFRPVASCTCITSGVSVELGYATGGSIDDGTRKAFTASYSLSAAGEKFALPHYDERREHIAPPRTLEGDVPLGFACGEKTAVFVHDRVATAWSLETKEELWTVDLPASRGAPKTVVGGGASLSCITGRIEGGLVHVPGIPGQAKSDTVLKLSDGSPAPAADAGAPKKPR